MAFLRDFIGQPPTVDRGNASDGSDHAGHGILSPEGSDSCEAGLHDSSYVRHCGGKDNARDLLRALFPDVPFDLGQRVDDIPDSELQLLDMSACDGRPENLLIERLLVPPVAIRPSVDAGPQGSNEDDLTVKLSEILTVNSIIRNALLGGKASVASLTLTLTLNPKS